ncbi:TRAF3-interacting protein 1 isoform X2 [Anguilla anguilla]|uniref:TRAF3-interacting protein 1 isoform X2 n=1 Tax=Anguilla anguilla TaxID=7936 RepID=UPI0015AD72D0|nr:TRAF3-interacting protein 1 isoform X2 [Anguilla anguilla]
MNASVAKKTQETLGKVIKKPPLTEKLLSKPPFRYLHDIFSEVIRTTGFMKGLYLEAEMKSDNVKEKEAKMAFLQKAIDVVALVSGEALAVRPARIVAGHEPEKTNELLQAIGKCCLNKLSSEEAVKRVLAGDRPDPRGKPSTSSKSQDKENREGKERQRDREEKKEAKEQSGSREEKGPGPQREEGRRPPPEKDRHREGERPDKARDRERAKDRDRDEKKDKSRDGEKDKSRDREKDKPREKEREKDREKDREKARERDQHRDRDREKRRDPDKDREREKDKGRERHKEPEEKSKEAERAEKKPRAPEETRNRQPPEQPVKTVKAEAEESGSPARIPRPSSAKGQRRRPKHGGQDETDSEGEADSPSTEKPAHLENGDATDSAPPQVAPSARRIPRPSSARPAPPRVRKQESHTEAPPAERLASSKPPAAVIVDGKKLSEDEDEDEQFVVEDARPPPMPELETESTEELQGEEKHGGLVKKILETKKNYETSPSSPKSKDQGRSAVSEASQRKERELVSREMDRLRSSIQTVCRSALPLGKIMDYIQEDMDSMQNELQTWRRENQEHAQALLQEQRVTDAAVEPLKAELSELEQLIRDQQDKICAAKSNILRNEEKIQKMLSSINFSSRT